MWFPSGSPRGKYKMRLRKPLPTVEKRLSEWEETEESRGKRKRGKRSDDKGHKSLYCLNQLFLAWSLGTSRPWVMWCFSSWWFVRKPSQLQLVRLKPCSPTPNLHLELTTVATHVNSHWYFLHVSWGQVTLEAKFRLSVLTLSWLSGLELTDHRTQHTHGSSHLRYTGHDSVAGHLSAILSKHIPKMPTLMGFLPYTSHGDHHPFQNKRTNNPPTPPQKKSTFQFFVPLHF